MLGHINGVDLYNDRLPKQAVNPVKPSINSKENLYRRFLMFKEFYVASCRYSNSIRPTVSIRILQLDSARLVSHRFGVLPPSRLSVLSYPLTATGRILIFKGDHGASAAIPLATTPMA